MVRLRPLFLLATAASFAACNSVHNDLSRKLLQPPPGWLAEPQDLGIAAEPFEVVLHSEASLTGWWIPSAAAHGRTVVLLHDEYSNASVVHPYYAFLHEAGFHVLVVDPRGFGHSKGTPSMRAWLYDLPALFDWLKSKPEVDSKRIAVFGTGLGSVAAMWAVMARHGTAAIFEHLPSLRDMLRESGPDGEPLDALSLGMLEFAGLPEDIEPDENAPKALVPALFLTTENEQKRDRLALMRAYGVYAGEKQMWVIPEAGRAPNAMLTYDGEYQRRIVEWLNGALGDVKEQVAASWRKGAAATTGGAWYEIQLDATPATHSEPWAVETCALLADGSPHFARTWLEGAHGSVRMLLPQEPQIVSATRVFAALGDADQGFQRNRSEISRAAAAIAPLWPRIEALRNDALPATDLDQFAADLMAAEAMEPFPPRLATELADVFAKLGKAWVASNDANRKAQGVLWLQRAVAAVPEKPQLHIWQGPTTTYGFAQAEAVDAARQLLRTLGQ
jgi:pimeloyl-ACP methyl ester carboxylesterase